MYWWASSIWSTFKSSYSPSSWLSTCSQWQAISSLWRYSPQTQHCNPPCISSSTSSQHWRSAPRRSPSPCCCTICSLAGATSRAPAALCRCSFSSALAPTSAACWACGALVGLGHTSFIFSLPCCGPNAIPHFFCEIQPVLQLVCIDTSVNEQQNILAAVLIILCPFGLILSSYGRILVTIFSIPSAAGRGLHLFFPPGSGISLLRYCHLYLYLP